MYEQFKNFSWLDFFLKIAQDFGQITLDSLVTLPSRDPPLNGNIESRSLPPRETRFRHLQISSDLVTKSIDLVTKPPDLVSKSGHSTRCCGTWTNRSAWMTGSSIPRDRTLLKGIILQWNLLSWKVALTVLPVWLVSKPGWICGDPRQSFVTRVTRFLWFCHQITCKFH